MTATLNPIVIRKTCKICGLNPDENEVARLLADAAGRKCDLCKKGYVFRRIEVFHDCGTSRDGPYATWWAYIPPEDDDQVVEIRLVPRRPMKIYGQYAHAHLACIQKALPDLKPLLSMGPGGVISGERG